jgi:hypothetical protein
MEKKMSKIGDYLPYIAMAAIGGAGIGLAGAGAGAGATIAPAAGAGAGAGALGAAGTQTGLALGSTTGAALAPETAFLAGLGGTSPAVAPLATNAATTSLAPHLAGGHYGTAPLSIGNPATPEALQLGTGYEGVSFYGDAPIASHLDTSYAPIDAMTPKSNYAFMGRNMESAIPQWKSLASSVSPAVEEGTKTLMDQLGLGYGDALALAANYYSSSMQPPNFQGTPPPTPTGRQYQYQPSTMAQIMDRTRGNYNRQIRRSTV